MPIKGLTDNNEMLGLPRIATLYKGGEKQEKERDGRKYEVMGPDLDYFRVEFAPEFATPEFAHLHDAWRSLYGEKPSRFENVFLTAATVDEVFQSWKEEWNATQTLIHRCDGEYQAQWYSPDFQMQMKTRIPCVSPANKDGIVEKQNCDCKTTGRIGLMLPEFIDLTGVLGYFAVTTHSINDILTVYRYLNTIERMYGTLLGVPFTFGRAPKEISAPRTKKGGVRDGRIKVKKSLFFLHVSPEFTQQRLLPVLAGQLPPPTAPGASAIDVEKAKRQLGGGGNHRRLPTGNEQGQDEVSWIAEKGAAFLEWATTRFQMSEGDVIVALENAVSYPMKQLTDWKADYFTAMAAVVAWASNYSPEEIEKATLHGFTETVGHRVYELAIEIAERVEAEEETA